MSRTSPQRKKREPFRFQWWLSVCHVVQRWSAKCQIPAQIVYDIWVCVWIFMCCVLTAHCAAFSVNLNNRKKYFEPIFFLAAFCCSLVFVILNISFFFYCLFSTKIGAGIQLGAWYFLFLVSYLAGWPCFWNAFASGFSSNVVKHFK